MFLSRKRNLIFPQSEHARLAGTIAAYWGNSDIPGPSLPQEAFALGVTIHDRGYGNLDSMGIGQVDDAIWLATQRRGVELRSRDPIADTVALMHIHRLVSHRDSRAAQELSTDIDIAINENLDRTPVNRIAFEQADTVTEACDMISFRFCFEESMQFTQNVFSGTELRDIEIRIDESGAVELLPWPLSVSELHGTILAYSSDGYPDNLTPILLPYSLIPGE